MGDVKFHQMSTAEILKCHVDLMEELRHRDILRSANKPTGDLAEYLFCKALNWQQAENSQAGYDAIDEAGIRYQIKGRRLHKRNSSRQLSALRRLKERPFDILAGVLFDESYTVTKAALIPHDVVLSQAKFKIHTNSHLFHLRDSVWTEEGVIDVTEKLQEILLL